MSPLTTTRDLVAELYQVEGKAEIISGEIVQLPMTGRLPGRVAKKIVFALEQYVQRVKKGEAFTDGNGFLVNLPRRRSFSPDAGYYVGPDSGMKFYQGAPVFAVEVCSENDQGPVAEREMAAKRADYFAAGTLVVWDVDLQNDDVVRVFRASDAEQPDAVHRRGQMADAEPVVPGWTMPVDDLFVP